MVERNKRSVEILTAFLQEASVLVLVFGILDAYNSNRITFRIGEVFAALGTLLLLAAFMVRWLAYRAARIVVKALLAAQEHVNAAVTEGAE